GGAYWYSLGAIVDKSGHDKYNGYQYSQGAGIHLAVGLLKDYDGWDFYTSNGVSQGCGHDFGFGFLWDVKGNDNYSAFSLSQGAGNANGIGMLIDESGRDGYLSKEPGNTRGYGNPRREYGSIGIFLDASGEDFYSVSGMDSTISNSSNWGVMNDYFLTDKPAQISGNGFKVDVDSINRPHDPLFTTEEYFIMAKTIEPRFSLWQEYGFRKLSEDSINTADFIPTKLGTSDHRETLLMRNLARRIGYSITEELLSGLEAYIEHSATPSPKDRPKGRQYGNKEIMNQAEVSFACYLLGEAASPLSKEILLQLTHDENPRIRASAVNALGKIKADTADAGFNERIRKRLAEMFYERLEWKLYNKDIAFALKQYKTKEDIQLLKDMMIHEYYGVRFIAEEALKELE
ncbi:MAG: HEAT repeat domain-containing protein, partial [Ignavibacteria bacterium]